MNDDFYICPKCGNELEPETCWNCGGEGGRGWEDLQFEDPLWYTPDDFIECSECYGTGCFYRCISCNRVYDIKELKVLTKEEK